MAVTNLEIDGMSCGGCVASVGQVFKNLHVTPRDIAVGKAIIQYNEADIPLGRILEALEQQGFTAREVDSDQGPAA